MTAFRATLEEMRDASLLIHVVDATAADLERRMSAVRTVLDDIELTDKPELLVFNQIDRLPEGEGALVAQRHRGVAVSALQSQGLIELLHAAEHILWGDQAEDETGHSLTNNYVLDGS
jgi:GTPase